MITLYNKIEKSRDNTSGFQVVENVEQLRRPFLMCISAQNNLSKAIYGIMREGAQAARVLTTQGVAAKFKLNDFPIDILGLRFESDEKYQQPYTELADKFLYPFLTRNGMEYDALRRQARKMNIFAFCEGVATYQGAEERLETLLRRDGFQDEEVHNILSQISLTALESLVETGGMHATSAAFIDVNDKEVACPKTTSYLELLDSEGRQSIFSPLGNSNSVLYVYKGTGIHNVKEFFREEDNVAEPAVCSIVSMFLHNSLDCETRDRLSELSVSQILARLEQYADETVDSDELLAELDKELTYNGATRYDDEMAAIRMELDDVYKILRKTNETFIRTLKTKTGQDLRLQSVIRGIHEFSSDVTFEQILTYAHMWQPKEGRDILSVPSDKQVRATIYADE